MRILELRVAAGGIKDAGRIAGPEPRLGSGVEAAGQQA